MKLLLVVILALAAGSSHSFKLKQRELSEDQWAQGCALFEEFLIKMDQYEHQHEHDSDEDHDGDEDHDSDEDGEEDDDDHAEEDRDEEEGHCAGPEGLIHCIAADFGGEDECVDDAEFEDAREGVGMNGPPQTVFFTMMDINADGCISEAEMMQIVVVLGEKCALAEAQIEES